MTTHDDMCTCDRCMREDHDRTLQRVGDLERENARLREALSEARTSLAISGARLADARGWDRVRREVIWWDADRHGPGCAHAAVASIDIILNREDGPS